MCDVVRFAICTLSMGDDFLDFLSEDDDALFGQILVRVRAVPRILIDFGSRVRFHHSRAAGRDARAYLWRGPIRYTRVVFLRICGSRLILF